MDALVEEGKALKLADDASFTTQDLMFMTIRVQKSNGSQIVINKDQLEGVFNGTDTKIEGNSIVYLEVDGENEAVEGISALVLPGGLEIDLEVEKGYLLLKDTKMSPELLSAIKGGVANESIAYYTITVLSSSDKGTKIAKIKLYADNTVIEEVK